MNLPCLGLCILIKCYFDEKMQLYGYSHIFFLFLQLRAFLKTQNLNETQIFAKVETLEVSEHIDEL